MSMLWFPSRANRLLVGLEDNTAAVRSTSTFRALGTCVLSLRIYMGVAGVE